MEDSLAYQNNASNKFPPFFFLFSFPEFLCLSFPDSSWGASLEFESEDFRNVCFQKTG